ISVISTSARLSARAAAMPAKPPPTIRTRFFPGTALVTASSSCGKDLVRTVDMETLHDSWGKPLSGMGHGGGLILNGDAVHRTSMPLSCRCGQYALEQYAREDQPEGHGHDDQKCRGAVRGDARQQSRFRSSPAGSTGRRVSKLP